MEKTINSFVKNRKLATLRVEDYIEVYTKVELSKLIGISRPTLDVRLSNHSWRMKELQKITEKLPELV